MTSLNAYQTGLRVDWAVDQQVILPTLYEIEI